MWNRIDNQEVGLEAAILSRKRNSSLVERACAENTTGLSLVPKLRALRKQSGSGAFPSRHMAYRKERFRAWEELMQA